MDRRALRRRLGRRPNAVRFSEVQRLLELSGWTLDRISGSHHVFRKASLKLTVPYRRPHLLAVYVRQALAFTAEEGDDE